MANLLTDLIEPSLLIDYIRQYDNEVLRDTANFTLDDFLPNRTTDDLEFRIRRGALNDVDIAEYRAWDTPAPMTGRPGTTYISGSLGPVSRQIPLGEEEYLRSRMLLEQNSDPIVSAIYADAERMLRAVQGRIELARGDIIDDGIVTINENGLQLTADFGRDASMSVTAGTTWDNPASTPISDLLGWVEDYLDLNGTTPGLMLAPRAIYAHLATNQEVLDFLAANGTVPQRATNPRVDDVLAVNDLPPIRIYDTQVRVNGVATRVLPDNKIYLMPPGPEPLGHTFYGTTAESLLLRERGLITAEAAPGVVAVVTRSEHPVQTFTVGTAIALPAMPNASLVLDAEVLP